MPNPPNPVVAGLGPNVVLKLVPPPKFEPPNVEAPAIPGANVEAALARGKPVPVPNVLPVPKVEVPNPVPKPKRYLSC